MSGDVLGCHRWGVLNAGIWGVEARDAANHPQSAGCLPPQQRTIWPKMSTAPGLKNPAVFARF